VFFGSTGDIELAAGAALAVLATILSAIRLNLGL